MERGSLTTPSPRVMLGLLAAFIALTSGADAQEEYRSSVVGTDYDFIVETDPSTFLCLEYKGQGLREMPDKRGPTPLVQQAFIFVAYFEDGTKVDMGLDADFETKGQARAEALRYVHRLGKLPTSLRRGVDRMVVHKGGRDTTAFSDVGLIVVYSANATKRISTHDLEETIFHESVHASWDKPHAQSSKWRAAQKTDGTFVTHYARKNPNGEDLAESALFAYTLLHHPGRIPPASAARIMKAIPARIAFVKTLLPPNKPIFQRIGPKYACDGSGTTFKVAPERKSAPTVRRPRPKEGKPSKCDVNLSNPGELSDILSNALMRGLQQDESAVRSFLDGVAGKYSQSDELMKATAARFGIDQATLNAQVQKFLHCNCTHGERIDTTAAPRSRPPEAVAKAGPPEPKTPVAPESAEVAEPSTQDGLGSSETHSILYLIALLLLLLLAVNGSTLVVLIRQSRTGQKSEV